MKINVNEENAGQNLLHIFQRRIPQQIYHNQISRKKHTHRWTTSHYALILSTLWKKTHHKLFRA